jgi:putative PIN family toxin of toxin-antitoxin system
MNAEGAPHQAVRQARASDTLAMSQPVFDEIVAVLHRPRLARFVDATLRADLLDQLVSGSAWFEPLVAVADCRDVADNMYLELAWAAEAAAIVSGDQDLLVPHPWRGIAILRPAVYVTRPCPRGASGHPAVERHRISKLQAILILAHLVATLSWPDLFRPSHRGTVLRGWPEQVRP